MNLLALPRFARFTRAEMLFSAKSFAAGMLALYIASRAGLPRPFWALLTSYVVANPLAGAVRSKALYRFCGTLIGCVATLLMVPALQNAPELLTLALALWVGGCLYLSLLDRTARSYVFMLAGYTAALIGFPAAEAPLNLFETAITRVEEIGLGILCGTIVHSLVLPVGLGPTLLGLLDRSLGDARQWFADVLGTLRRDGPRRDALLVDRQRLATDITQLRLLSIHVPFDTSHVQWTAGAIREMQDQIAALTPLLSATEDRLQALVESEGRIAPDVADVLAQVADWLGAETGSAAARGPALQALREALRKLGEGADTGLNDWARALRIGLAVRLEHLVTGWRACATLRRTIDAGMAGAAMPLRQTSGFGHRVLHRDRGMALLSALAAVLAVCLCSFLWIATAWPSGSAAALMAAVFCSFFATLDDPAPAINGFLKYFTVLSMPISAIYVLVLLPLVHDFGMLVLVCAPTLLVLGCVAARPTTSANGLAMIFGVAGTLALHDTASDDLLNFLNSNLGQAVGIVAAVLVTRAVRTVGVDWSAQRIRRATWRELGTMAAAPQSSAADDAYAARMLDRISLLAPRIAQADDRRNAEAAREDRGMRQRPAILGDERGDMLLREQDDVGRCDVVGDGHERLGVSLLRQLALRLEQHAQDPRTDVFDIVLARAQISIVHLLEHCDQRIACLAQRRLGVNLLAADVRDRGVGDRAIVEHQEVRVDKHGDVARRAGRDLLAHLAQLLARALLRANEADDLAFDLVGRQRTLGDIEIARMQLLHAGDGDAARDADA